MASPRRTPTGIERETPTSGTDDSELPSRIPDPRSGNGDNDAQVFPPREGTPTPDLPGGVEDVPKQEL
jgi:hypothetical protein